MRPGASGAENKNASAVGDLLPRVLAIPGLLRACTSHQDGLEFSLYTDGDLAAAQGHLSLLRLRHSLSESTTKRECGDQSISSINGGNGSGLGGGDSSCYSSCSGIESEEEQEGKVKDQEQQEGKRLPRIGEEGEGERDEDQVVIADLNFSHRAADWAAAQGHLEVVRSVVTRKTTGVRICLILPCPWIMLEEAQCTCCPTLLTNESLGPNLFAFFLEPELHPKHEVRTTGRSIYL